MASTIKIKRSGTAPGAPAALKSGELSYTYSSGVDRLYFGKGDDGNGNATSIVQIGGEFFTNLLDHTAGTLTASSAIITDANNKIDQLNVDNLTLNGNTLSSTDANGNIVLSPNGTGKISFYSQYTFPTTAGTLGQSLTLDGSNNLVWTTISSNTATNLAAGTAGQIPYQSAPGTTAFFGPGTAGNVLVSNGAAAPAYQNTLTLAGTTDASSTATGAFQVRGGVGIGGKLYVGGEVQVGNHIIPAANGTVDLGSPTNRFRTLYVTSSTIDIGGVTLGLSADGALATSRIKVTGTTQSSSTITGALQVIGGVGIGGNLYVGGEIVAEKLTIQLTTVTTTFIQTDDIVQTTNVTNATNTTTGALIVAGGAGIGRDVWIGGNLTVLGNATGRITTSTNLAGGTAGQVPYQTAVGATGFYGPGTAGQILVSAGAAAPVYTNTGSIYVGRANLADTATVAYSNIGTHTAGTGLTGSAYNGSTNQTWTLNTSTLMATAVTANNLAGGTAGQLAVQTAAGATSFVSTGSLYVNRAVNADKWTTARTVTFTGDTTGTFSIDGSADVTSVTLTIQPNSVALGTDTTGNYVASGAVSGFGLSGSASSEGAAFTVSSNATSTNVNSTLVFRDASGNFAANVVTADVVGTASNANDLTGGAAGSIPYQSAAGVTVFLAGGQDGKVLIYSTATNAPVWGDIDGGTY